jgi:hypothetical protein
MWAVMTQREKMTDNGLTHAILGKRGNPWSPHFNAGAAPGQRLEPQSKNFLRNNRPQSTYRLH